MSGSRHTNALWAVAGACLVAAIALIAHTYGRSRTEGARIVPPAPPTTGVASEKPGAKTGASAPARRAGVAFAQEVEQVQIGGGEQGAALAAAAAQRAAKMGKRSRIGQTLMVGIREGWSSKKPGLLGEVPVGAVILYARNTGSAAHVKDVIAQIRAVQARLTDIPPFIAIDHEGGRVNRLKFRPFTIYPSNGDMAHKANALQAVRREGRTMAAELMAAGIQVNLAPVMDVTTNPHNTDIGTRSYGGDTRLVQQLGVGFIESGLTAGGFLTAKHFPGYGPIAENPHEYLPTVDISREEWEAVHLPPFVAAIQAGVPSFMTGHVVYPALDPSRTPASLSKAITTDLLRGRLGFRGLIMTDDLEMGAITRGYGVPKASLMALNAGADMLLICHSEARQRATIKHLEQALGSGQLPHQRLNDAVAMILSHKITQGVWTPKG